MNIEPAPCSQGRVNSTASSPTLNPAFTDDGHQPGGPWWVGALLLRPIRVREQEPSVRGCPGDDAEVSEALIVGLAPGRAAKAIV